MQTPQTEVDGTHSVSHLTFRRSTRRNHTPGFDSLVSSLHFESTWEAENISNGTPREAYDGEVDIMEDRDGEGVIRLQ